MGSHTRADGGSAVCGEDQNSLSELWQENKTLRVIFLSEKTFKHNHTGSQAEKACLASLLFNTDQRPALPEGKGPPGFAEEGLLCVSCLPEAGPAEMASGSAREENPGPAAALDDNQMCFLGLPPWLGPVSCPGRL